MERKTYFKSNGFPKELKLVDFDSLGIPVESLRKSRALHSDPRLMSLKFNLLRILKAESTRKLIVGKG